MSRVICSVFFVFVFSVSGLTAERMVAFVPASLTEVMNELASNFNREQDADIVLSIAGTAQLARQLDAGAPANIFISADKRWMDWAETRGLIDPSSKVQFAGNSLVVAGRRESENWVDIQALLTEFPFAMGEPDSVPVGKYAREALISKRWWDKAKGQAIFSENTRLSLRRLAIGEVGAAIVYGTDVAVEPEVRTLMVFPSESHEPIAYWAAATTINPPQSDRFLKYLVSSAANTVFAKSGFVQPPEER